MHLTSMLPLALLTLITATPLQPRSTPTVLSDISAISSSVSTLDSLVITYNGTAAQITPIVDAVQCLQKTIQIATNDTVASPNFSEEESESIAAAVQSLTGGVIGLIRDLDAKHDVVKAAGEIDVVEDALESLQSEANAFLTAVTDRTTEDGVVTQIDTDSDEINYAFNQAIGTYAS